jgi:hypothetical protein
MTDFIMNNEHYLFSMEMGREGGMETLTGTDIERLVENQVREGKQLEFKLTLPGKADSDKKEFLADISSFANALGGTVLYGVEETDGVARALPGLACESVDTEIQRLENLLRDGIQPRLVGLQVHPVHLASGALVLAIHVPRSWTAPHMVILGGSSRFFSRNSNGKYPLDVYELRRAFAVSETVTERVRGFRVERLGRIVAGELPASIGAGPYVVLHVVPYSALAGGTNVVNPAKRETMNSLPPMFSSGWNSRFNFDGFLTWFTTEKDDLGLGSYVQLFRNGCIESVDRGMLNAPRNSQFGDGRWIPSGAFEKEIIEALRSSCALLAALGSEPPIAVLLSLVGVSGYRMFTEPSAFAGRPIERSDLFVPEIVIESFAFDAGSALRPAIDAVWNACGYAKSPNYDAAGNWRSRS